MKAATLKGLVIHTADEAGTSPGPDYRFGWGLMDTYSAASEIFEDTASGVISENVLHDGEIFRQTIFANGREPLKVTISWTDLPGTPAEPAPDVYAIMLVNNLDLKIEHNGTTWYPWKLDPASPSSPATCAGPNDVDNVEQVLIESPDSGEYVVTIDHRGTITGGSQEFSMLVSGTNPGSQASAGQPSSRTSGNESVMIYPNPAFDRITLEKESSSLSEVIFYNSMGQIVKKTITADVQTQFDVKDLESGLYVILVRTGSGDSYTKMYKN
jgi:hypothetical protein